MKIIAHLLGFLMLMYLSSNSEKVESKVYNFSNTRVEKTDTDDEPNGDH